MTKITMTKKALNTKIPISIGLCPFFFTTPGLLCPALAAVDFVLGGDVSSNKGALVRFNEGGLSSLSATVIMSLVEMPSLS